MTDSSDPSAGRDLAACYDRQVAHPPVWLMRPAGRDLPEYGKPRGKVPFLFEAASALMEIPAEARA